MGVSEVQGEYRLVVNTLMPFVLGSDSCRKTQVPASSHDNALTCNAEGNLLQLSAIHGANATVCSAIGARFPAQLRIAFCR